MSKEYTITREQICKGLKALYRLVVALADFFECIVKDMKTELVD